MQLSIKRFINKLRDRKKFTLKKYAEFLNSISKYKIVTCRDFQNYHNASEVVITLKHDIDSNIDRSVKMAILESDLKIQSTYFVLHTASYYKNCIEKLKFIQALGHEIGFHNDLMSIAHPEEYLINELKILRGYGLKMIGTSAHGNKSLRKGVNNLHYWQTHSIEFYGFKYEAYSLDSNIWYSDCTFIEGHRWHPDMMNDLKPGDRLQILIHPEFWQ
jgi:hypothetical protein